MVGIDCKLYINTGTYGSPTWTEIALAKDVVINDTRAVGDSSVRGYEMASATLGQRTLQLTFDAVHVDGNTAIAAIKSAFVARSVVGILALNGPVATPGKTGFRADVVVSSFTRNEPMSDAVIYSIVLDGTTDAAHTVEDYTVPTPP